MHSKTYSVTLAPRDEEPSLSSSEEKSSEFDWLESKITRKQKYEKQSKSSVFYFLTKLYKGCVSENKLPDYIYDRSPSVKEITKLYIRGYSPFFQT